MIEVIIILFLHQPPAEIKKNKTIIININTANPTKTKMNNNKKFR